MSEGRVRWDGHETWYRVVGALGSGPPPLVICHGGPGTPHDYMTSVADVARSGRACVLYDQIGANGHSSQHTGASPSMWTVELFLDELDALIAHLDVAGAHHVLGHSWGGMLAMEHALRHPRGLRSIVVENTPAAIQLWAEEARRLTDEILAELGATTDPTDANDSAAIADFKRAKSVYYARHVCRIDPVPDELQRSLAKRAADPSPYEAMIGVGINDPTGSLADWDIRPRLGDLRTPTLVVSGRYDETTPRVVGPLADGITGARWVVFEESSHTCHLEERERFVATVTEFFAQND